MDLSLLITSFLAGVLTVLAPCVIPVLPIIVGGSVVEEKDTWRPYIIAGSLAVSVVIFTLLLRASTSLIEIPDTLWSTISGVILMFFGLAFLFHKLWEQVALKLKLGNHTGRWLNSAGKRDGVIGGVLVGAALGPVFTSCSPTYAIILATVLPVSYAEGVIYLIAYAIGLGAILLVVALAGRSAVMKFGWAIDPNSKFRRAIGAIFLAVAILVLTGFDKDLQTWLLDNGVYDPISEIEMKLLSK